MTTETLITVETAREAATTYREATAKVDKIESAIKIKNAETAAKHERDLSEARQEQADSKSVLEQYAEQENETLFDSGKRSIAFSGLNIGYRKSAAKLVTNGKKDWKAVLVYLLGSPELKESFVETKEVIDKKALIKADAKTLKKIGVAVEQTDNFFVKL